MEYMMLMGFTLLLIGPLLVLYSQHNAQIQESFTIAQATRAGEKLSAAAERVYFAGSPSKERVLVTIPDNIESFMIANRSIEFVLSNPPDRQVNIYAQAQLIATTINPSQGKQYFDVQATTSGVSITES
jgi:hypothetical protein